MRGEYGRRVLVRRLVAPAVAVLLAVAPAAACSRSDPAPRVVPAPSSVEASEPRVLAISVDGLRPDVVERLGPEGTPTLHRLLAEGAGTLNARTARERTETLPDHTTQLTGRRVDAARGGHGVTWNEHRPGSTVRRAAGGPVRSVLSEVHRGGGEVAVFVAKQKLTLVERSWSRAVDRFVLEADPPRLVRRARRDLARQDRAFTFVHLPDPDAAGHTHGFGSAAYDDAVREADRLVGRLLARVEAKPRLARSVRVVLTSDHGGTGKRHDDARRAVNYTVPFVAWGPGIEAGDLYDLNPDYRDPGGGRPGYGRARQPVRNGDLANLSLHLLGLPAVPGSQMNDEQDLDVTSP